MEKWIQRCEVGLSYLSILQLIGQILWFSGKLQFLSQTLQWDEWFIKQHHCSTALSPLKWTQHLCTAMGMVNCHLWVILQNLRQMTGIHKSNLSQEFSFTLLSSHLKGRAKLILTQLQTARMPSSLGLALLQQPWQQDLHLQATVQLLVRRPLPLFATLMPLPSPGWSREGRTREWRLSVLCWSHWHWMPLKWRLRQKGKDSGRVMSLLKKLEVLLKSLLPCCWRWFLLCLEDWFWSDQYKTDTSQKKLLPTWSQLHVQLKEAQTHFCSTKKHQEFQWKNEMPLPNGRLGSSGSQQWNTVCFVSTPPVILFLEKSTQWSQILKLPSAATRNNDKNVLGYQWLIVNESFKNSKGTNGRGWCGGSRDQPLPVTDRLVTAGLARGSTGLTVRVVAALLVTRLGVVATWRSKTNKTAQLLKDSGTLDLDFFISTLAWGSYWGKRCI